MKKVIFALVCIASITYGTVQINWKATAGFYFDPSFNALLSPGGTTKAQLMYSPDAVYDNILLSGLGDVNDTIFATYNITDGITSSQYADFSAPLFSQPFVSGYTYALIFQDSTCDYGDWYFYTPMISLQDITGVLTPQELEMNTDLNNGNAINTGATVAQVVPEPATALLFGMGAMGAWLIRRNKIKSKEAADA